MCNVYAMYSYEPNSKSTNEPAPLKNCWDNSAKKLSA